MEKTFTYKVSNTWTGNLGTGTSDYKEYSRAHRLSAEGKTDILASSDPAFLGDESRWNPEEILVASLSACHMLWYLHLCADAKVVVTAYEDHPEGIMILNHGLGSFKSVTLHPKVTVQEKSMIEKAKSLHEEAHKRCYVAKSVNFPVSCSASAST